MLTILVAAFLRYKDKIGTLDYMVLTTLGSGIELLIELIALLAILGVMK